MAISLAVPREERRARAARAWALLPRLRIEALIRAALDEDIGHGDITSALTVDPDTRARALVRFKQPGIVAGLQAARLAMILVDPTTGWRDLSADGEAAGPCDAVAEVEGFALSILSSERVALNLTQRMGGIAWLTERYVSAVGHTPARILDTRKTAPGLRLLDKYAVVCGGGQNHRFGLDDGILIKDNHIAACGGVASAIARARQGAPAGMKIEVEADDLSQVEEAVRGGADIILLDNMSPGMMAEAVRLVAGRAQIEASGGVSLDTVAAIAETGVNFISVGALTHSAPTLDVGLDLTLL
jgi:nicotinate-nucleotide pyrophosphorylase (carboxylating)